MIGQTISHYKILEKLGEGGMGIVYKAHDTKLDRPVAIKFLSAGHAVTEQDKARFIHEARAASILEHSNICTIYEIDETADGQLFIVMPAYEGTPLNKRIEEGPLTISEAIDIAIQIADGLQAAHEKGIVHRDIKGSNIFITSKGQVKVMDFGLARSVGMTQVTKTGMTVGTVPYMSPEQARGEKVDHRTDIWSLGVILYEMITGRMPFRSDYSEAIVYSILNEEPEPLSSLRSNVPMELEHIVTKSLRKEPNVRYQHCDEMLADLRELKKRLDSGAVRRPTMKPVSTDKKNRWMYAGIGATILFIFIVLYYFVSISTSPTVTDRTSIAVLPFQNLSAESEHAYFAGGLHDELLTQLSKVAALSLRGRTSVMGYSGTTKSIGQIADELNVGLLVEGSVQVVGGRLRVNVQLINALTDEHMWADSYDRVLDDAFAIQRDIAQQIVAATNAALGSSERVAMAEVPTNNPEAYRLYLQGREYFRRPGFQHQNVEVAIRLYERAIAMDPEFALAYAALSDAHGRMHWWRVDPSPERVALQREAAETALRLAPDLPQSHLAMGQLYFMAYRDFQRALDAFTVALEGLPNDVEVMFWISTTHRRLGNWDEVLTAYEKATELDPRDANLHYEMGGRTLRFLRRYADAIQAFDRALELAPDLHSVVMSRAWTFVEWQGQLDSLRRALERVPAEQFLRDRVLLLYRQRDADAMLELLNAAPVKAFERQGYIWPKSFLAARAHRLRGDEQMARAAFHDALSILDSVMVVLPDDWRVHAARGLALAGLGRNDEALREARWLEQSFVYREDLYDRLERLAPIRAEILAHAGKADGALDEIERLLAGPSGLSVNELRLNPVWDPIREHPRFNSLLTKYSEI
jgi:eukaryotic-like serine/threonine-protein kinase